MSDSVAAFLANLTDVKQAGNRQWQARCPAHAVRMLHPGGRVGRALRWHPDDVRQFADTLRIHPGQDEIRVSE